MYFILLYCPLLFYILPLLFYIRTYIILLYFPLLFYIRTYILFALPEYPHGGLQPAEGNVSI